MSVEFAIAISIVLIVTVLVALFSKSVSLSLIMLFYSSLALGILFTYYNATLLGVVHIITFAGAVSVMLLTVVLMTGEDKVGLGLSSQARISTFVLAVAIPAIGALSFLASSAIFNSTASSTSLPSDLFAFIWTYRPWDMLILIMVFAAALITVVNLLSKELPENPK